MNHIHRLQADLAEARDELRAKDEALQTFLVLLDSSKFVGTDPDGSRRDWIAVGDVRNRLMLIRAAID